MLSVYPACFYKESNGYSVIFPDLNWLSTCGDSLENAMEMAVDCLAGYLYTCQADGDSIPKPSNPSDIDAAAIAKELDLDAPACASFVSLISVDVARCVEETGLVLPGVSPGRHPPKAHWNNFPAHYPGYRLP